MEILEIMLVLIHLQNKSKTLKMFLNLKKKINQSWRIIFLFNYCSIFYFYYFVLHSLIYTINYKQGIKVRSLKEAKVDKSELQPEIDLLLQLKSKLSIAKGLPADDGKKKKQKQSKK